MHIQNVLMLGILFGAQCAYKPSTLFLETQCARSCGQARVFCINVLPLSPPLHVGIVNTPKLHVHTHHPVHDSDKEKFQIDYADEAIRGVLAVDAGNVTWPAPQKPPPPPPPAKDDAEVSYI